MKKIRKWLVVALAPVITLVLAGCYESTTTVELSVDESDELLVEIEHTHWIDLGENADLAEANQFLEDFNADSRLVRTRSLTANGRVGAEYQATITESEFANGPITIEVAYGTMVVSAETVFGSRKVEFDLDSTLEYGIEPNSSIEIIGPEYWMTNYSSTNSEVWMQPTDDELLLGWSRYGARYADGTQPWTVNVFYEEPIEPEPDPEPAPEPEPEQVEPQESAETEELPETDESADAATSEIAESEPAGTEEEFEDQLAAEAEQNQAQQVNNASPISFAVWMVLVLILAVVLGLAIYLIRGRQQT